MVQGFDFRFDSILNQAQRTFLQFQSLQNRYQDLTNVKVQKENTLIKLLLFEAEMKDDFSKLGVYLVRIAIENEIGEGARKQIQCPKG